MRQSQIGRRKNGLPYSRDRWPSRRFALAIRLEEALALRKKAEAICLELGDKSGLGYCYWQWGRLARRQGDKQVEPHTRSAALRHEDAHEIRFKTDLKKCVEDGSYHECDSVPRHMKWALRKIDDRTVTLVGNLVGTNTRTLHLDAK